MVHLAKIKIGVAGAAIALLAVWGALLWAWGTGRGPSAAQASVPTVAASAPELGARWWRMHTDTELQLDGLVTADGIHLPPKPFAGHWTVMLVGFTTCSQVCPLQLRMLDAAFATPAWREAAGADAQAAFLSIDPLNDTPERLRAFLAGYSQPILGLTGQPAATDRAVQLLGAGYRRSDDGFDHSNSLFVIGPDERVAGVLLRPSSPSLLVADFLELKKAWQADPAQGRP